MITTLTEFTEVIEGNYNIKDLPTYTEYKKSRGGKIVPQSEIDLLSPDSVNSSSFWEWIEKNPELAKDAICFGATKDKPIDEVNRWNLNLASSTGALNQILVFRDCENAPILDIGPGYGMLKQFVEKYTKLVYYAADVYPKFPGVMKIAGDGSTLPPNLTETGAQFALIVAINVFQHLSVKQRRHYYEQISKILHPTGYFTVTCCVKNLVKGFVGEDGKEYMCHYGQYTEIQTFEEIKNDLEKYFFIYSYCQRMDGCATFHCQIKNQ